MRQTETAQRHLQRGALCAALCVLSYLLLQQALALLTQALAKGPLTALAGGWAECLLWLLYLIGQAIPLVLPIGAVLRLGLIHRFTAGRSTGLAAPVFLVYLGASPLANLAAARIGQVTGSRQSLSLPEDPAALLVAFCTICLLPAVCEECFFRGVLQRLLRPGGAWLAIWGQSILFALLHRKLAAVAFALPAGLLFGWLAEVTGGLRLGIGLHFVNNTLAFLLLWLQGTGQPDLAASLSRLLLCASPVLLAAGLASLWPRRRALALPRGPLHPAQLLRSAPWALTAGFLLARALLDL